MANVLSVYSQGTNYSVSLEGKPASNMQTNNLTQALNNQHNRRFEKKKGTFKEYWHTIMALFWKNITRLRRNIP